MQRAKTSPSPELLATAERLLTGTFGSTIRLREEDDLTANGSASGSPRN